MPYEHQEVEFYTNSYLLASFPVFLAQTLNTPLLLFFENCCFLNRTYFILFLDHESSSVFSEWLTVKAPVCFLVSSHTLISFFC
jgi:hypothetical protein